jgi:hypothetical protein
VQKLRESLGGVDLLQSEPIAIIGLGCRFPGGATDPDRLWSRLENGVDAVRQVPPDRFDADRFYSADSTAAGKIVTRQGGFLEEIDAFDAGYFGVAPREASLMDPQQRMLLEVAMEALEDAGQLVERLAGTATGVFVAVYNHDYLRYQYADPEQVEAYTSSGTAYAIAPAVCRFSTTFAGRRWWWTPRAPRPWSPRISLVGVSARGSPTLRSSGAQVWCSDRRPSSRCPSGACSRRTAAARPSTPAPTGLAAARAAA